MHPAAYRQTGKNEVYEQTPFQNHHTHTHTFTHTQWCMAIITRTPPLTAVLSAARHAMVLHNVLSHTHTHIHTQITPSFWHYRHNMWIPTEVKSAHKHTHAYCIQKKLNKDNKWKDISWVKLISYPAAILFYNYAVKYSGNISPCVSATTLISRLANAIQCKRCDTPPLPQKEEGARAKSHRRCDERFEVTIPLYYKGIIMYIKRRAINQKRHCLCDTVLNVPSSPWAPLGRITKWWVSVIVFPFHSVIFF